MKRLFRSLSSTSDGRYRIIAIVTKKPIINSMISCVPTCRDSGGLPMAAMPTAYRLRMATRSKILSTSSVMATLL